ncbi:hypothetical protein IEQ34_000731 [Dendrobium chrysotoxum]|uniref:Uncharacterized protein n=1 Tax=Dendrobium chrysotoxum TaxID=161865 RepID=A0AAV7HUE0_DENCH|nr:hypothetical protein IEQ34_000731 [Dendrobium chrysotoxum]
MPYWVSISMEVIGNNLYEAWDNLSLALETDEVASSEWEVEVILMIFIGTKGYCYAYMMPCWVPMSIEFIGNNLYEIRDNPSFMLEMDGVVASVPTPMLMDSLEVVKECGVDVKLELSLWLSSSEVEYRKWVREINETIIVKKSKME